MSSGPAHAGVADRVEPTDDRQRNARLRRVLHSDASVLRAISFWRAAARQCRTARKPLGPAPWLPTSRAPPPTRSCTAWCEEHLETFLAAAAARTDGVGLPRFIEREFRGFLVEKA